MTTTEAKRVYLQNENDEILLPYSSQAIEDGDGNVIADTYLKRDVSSNITTSGKSFVAGLSKPSEKFTTLSAGAVGSTYTAPANGWFYMKGDGIAAFCFFGLIAITESGDELFSSEMVVYYSGNGLSALLPVEKGQVIKINYYNVNISKFRFYYAEGDAPTESEA